MRGFLTFSKTISFAFTHAKPTQQFKVQMRLATLQLQSQFRLCSSLATLRLGNLSWPSAASLAEDSDESEIDATISNILSVTLKSNQAT